MLPVARILPYCARSENVHAFRPLICSTAKACPDRVKAYTVYETTDPHHFADATGVLSIDQLRSWLPLAKESDVYFLGPKPFMKGVKFYLASMGVPEERFHYEFFGPAEDLETSNVYNTYENPICMGASGLEWPTVYHGHKR